MRHARSGGTERTLDQLASALAASGHEPVIVCRSHVDPPDPRVRFEVLRPFALEKNAVVVVHNGVDLERFHPRRRSAEGAALRRALALEPRHVVVLFLGTGYGRKGLRRTIDAFACASRSHPDARLVV